MRLTKIDIDGFRSFRDRTVLTLPDSAGLFLIRGRNEDEPSLGANGAGKSTFWDALCWCLYGKTARRLGADTVRTWRPTGPTKVRVCLDVGGRPHELLRSRGSGPIRLQLDGRVVDQAAIDELVGLSYERFLHVVLMGQFGQLFPDLGPTDRLNLLSGVLELDLWTSASSAAASTVKTLSEQAAQLDRSSHGLSERLVVLRERLKDVMARRREQEIRRQEQIEDQQALVAAATEKLGETRTALEKAQDAAQRAEGLHEDQERKLGELEKLRAKLREKTSRLPGPRSTCWRSVRSRPGRSAIGRRTSKVGIALHADSTWMLGRPTICTRRRSTNAAASRVRWKRMKRGKELCPNRSIGSRTTEIGWPTLLDRPRTRLIGRIGCAVSYPSPVGTRPPRFRGWSRG